MKTLLVVGTSDAAKFVALRPGFDACYVIDSDEEGIEYVRSLFKFDRQVHFSCSEPSSLDLEQFCLQNGIDEIDTLMLSLSGSDDNLPGAIEHLLRTKRVRLLECPVNPRYSGPKGSGGGPEAAMELMRQVAREGYECTGEASGSRSAGSVRWLRKGSELALAVGTQEGTGRTEKSRYSFNLVYYHLPDTGWHVARRGKVSMTVSSVPQQGCDLYLYLDAFSYRGKQEGYNLLFLAEPHTVLPGSFNEDVWADFDHVFTFYDALVERGEQFTKVLSCRHGWTSAEEAIAEEAITEDTSHRERLYPLEGRNNSICMINGNKFSWVSGELYSKRMEAALWFCCNSDIFFDVYGYPPYLLPNFKGGVEKGKRLSVLAKYKYNWCFENTDHPVFARGYVDKILDCLETRTVPIYLGNPNIEKYVPKDCFIDFRDFGSYAAVNDYLHRITEDEYMAYVENIDRWVASGGLRPYSWYTLYDYLIHWYSKQTGIELRSLAEEGTEWERELITPKIGAAMPILWTFDDLRFKSSPFMNDEDLLKTRPWEKMTADVNDRFQRALGLASQDKYNEALREIALTGFSFNASHHLACAQLMQLNGLQDPAFVQLSIALQLDPGNSYVHNQLGALHFQKSQLAQAEEEFRKAVELDSGNHLARKNLAFLLLHTGRKREALPMIKSVEPYFPEEVRGWQL
jgi:tetratricopeptide (TPR) repeat protein